jgi:LuxR family quorum sensing-dependent transcriptional regulator
LDDLTQLAMDFCESVDECSSITKLSTELMLVAKQFGFTRFSMDRSLQSHDSKHVTTSIAHNWPKSWVDRYITEQYFNHDKVVEFAYRQIRPWTWNEVRKFIPSHPIGLQMADDAAAIGMVDGFVVAVHDSRSLQGLVSLGAEQVVEVSPWERKLLHMICLHAQMRATEIRDSQHRAIPQLSERELEVFRWLAKGKSLSQAAEALDLSRSTAKTFVERARRKMEATSTTQAIITAIKSKQIKP